MKDKKHKVFEIDGIKTLPLYVLYFKAPESGIPAMGSAKCELVYKEPEYEERVYKLDAATKQEIENDVAAAIGYVQRWPVHSGNIRYFFQFKDDPDGSAMMVNFHRHTEIVSAICDSRLGIDTTPLWNVVRQTMMFKEVQARYRAETNHDESWDHYAEELIDIAEKISGEEAKTASLIPRIVNMLKLRQFEKDSTTLGAASKSVVSSDSISLFYSYSHKDEGLRNDLETHLAALKRKGFIDQWHDRKIEAGDDWKIEIDDHLEKANVILLLISADFIASDYCYEIEVKRAMERHVAGQCQVIPIILRSCDWSATPLAMLKALPRDAMAVTSWENKDEAFTDVAKGIRGIIERIRNAAEVGKISNYSRLS